MSKWNAFHQKKKKKEQKKNKSEIRTYLFIIYVFVSLTSIIDDNFHDCRFSKLYGKINRIHSMQLISQTMISRSGMQSTSEFNQYFSYNAYLISYTNIYFNIAIFYKQCKYNCIILQYKDGIFQSFTSMISIGQNTS